MEARLTSGRGQFAMLCKPSQFNGGWRNVPCPPPKWPARGATPTSTILLSNSSVSPLVSVLVPMLDVTPVDQGRLPKWALGPFEFPHSPPPRAEHSPTLGRLLAALVMVGTQTTTMTTVISTVAMHAASAGPIYLSYIGHAPTGFGPSSVSCCGVAA